VTSPPAARREQLAKVALVVFVVAMLALAYRSGVFAEVSDPRSLAKTVVAMGTRGHVAFVLAYTVLQPFAVPGTIFIVAASLLWPWPTAFALSMIGTMGASVVGFSFARFVARDWISARIPERFRKYESALETNAFSTVFLLRLIFWMPQLLHAFLGVSKVPFWTHFFGSLLGYVPPLLAVSYLGSEIIDLDGGLKPSAWPIMGVFLAVSLVIVGATRYLERRQAKRQAAAR